MAAAAVLTYCEGRLEVPAEIREQLHLTDGMKLLVTVLDSPTLSPEDGNSFEARAVPGWRWVPNDEWRSLQGSLEVDPEYSTTEMRARERAWELEHDERKFGPFPKR